MAWAKTKSIEEGASVNLSFHKVYSHRRAVGVYASIAFLYGPLGSQGDSCPGNIAPSPPVEWRQLLSLVDVMGIQEY